MKKAFSFGDKSVEAAVARINAVRRIAVIGAGTMGQGIILDLLNKTDYDLVVLDVSDDAMAKAQDRFRSVWQKQVRDGQIRQEDAKRFEARVCYTKDYANLRDADIVWEVATERSEIKAKIFRLIEQNGDADHVAAVFSNTSSHTTAELASLFESQAFREKFLTVHSSVH